MSRQIVLDTGPLSAVIHPRYNRASAEWFRSMLESGWVVIIPEIADYELRRELIRSEKDKSVARLDHLKTLLAYLPIDTKTMLQAAKFWAEARNRRHATADPKELDGDAILAAQAALTGSIVATTNVGHLSQFVEIRPWSEIGYAKTDDV